MIYVVLAGGTGTRLWPLSRNGRPKQFAQIISELSMLEETLGRLEVDKDYSQVYISTSEAFAKTISEILPDFPPDHLITEPEKRDTGPAYAFVAALLSQTHPDEPVAFIPSDHYIRDGELFRRSLKVGESLITETGKMVDIGIVPTYPSVNLGYTKLGKHFRDVDDVHLYEFAGHIEKPPLPKAKEYLKNGTYLWHASYYMWTPAKLFAAYEKYAPEIAKAMTEIVAAHKSKNMDQVRSLWHELPKISIDYAVTEKMDLADVLIIKGEFGWSDVGSWDQLYDQLSNETDEQNNLVRGAWHGLDTSSSMIFGAPDKLIATIVISDLVIVDTPDVLLICPKGRAQDVKKIVEQVEQNKQGKYL